MLGFHHNADLRRAKQIRAEQLLVDSVVLRATINEKEDEDNNRLTV